MKKTNFLAFLVIFFCFPLYSQVTHWEYPIRPGNEEWAALPTTADRIKAIQVPENVLTKLSDKQLLDLILDYPFFWTICFRMIQLLASSDHLEH